MPHILFNVTHILQIVIKSFTLESKWDEKSVHAEIYSDNK